MLEGEGVEKRETEIEAQFASRISGESSLEVFLSGGGFRMAKSVRGRLKKTQRRNRSPIAPRIDVERF